MTSVVQAFDDAMSGWLSLAWMFAGGLLVTVIHEAGHLSAAIATGQREIAMNIGSHGAIMDRRLGDVRLRAKAVSAPWRTAGSVSFDAGLTTARDMAIIAAAGPAANIVGAVLTGLLAQSLEAGTLATLLAMATVLGLFLGLGNLIPFSYHEGTRRQPGARFETDGLQLLHAARVMVELRRG